MLAALSGNGISCSAYSRKEVKTGRKTFFERKLLKSMINFIYIILGRTEI